MGVTLNAIQPGRLWWIVLLIGAAMLLIVLVGEYTVADRQDANFPTATIGLTTLSFILFLVLAINLRANAVRYYLLMPALSLAVGLISLRFLYLRLQEQDLLTSENVITAAAAAFTSAFLVAQILTALHFWSISPIGFGLALIGPAYAVTNFLGSMTEGKAPRQAIFEPIAIVVVFWGLAFWIR
jgi:hypothetical protein